MGSHHKKSAKCGALSKLQKTADTIIIKNIWI
jgi:hypothetical protein